MNKVLPIVTILFLILIISGNILAQQSNNYSWNLRITAQYGYPLGSNDWEYSHPFYTGTGVQTINETGTFNAKSVWGGGVELSKGYFGINTDAGIIPSEIIINKSGELYNFNSIFLEIEGIFFPLANTTDFVIPLLKIGGGGMTSNGDLNNSALFFSLSGGARTYFTEKFGVSLMIKGRHITYDEIPMDENVTGDISFTNFAIEFQLVYTLL
ncbi:MAG: hypothetical protein OQJ93_08320 [Ignavibacteriaceae bacterium]|jgi:hypothetical protein|nr:hypothetical protein [Ignavibacteriaceae bacterium]